MCVSRALSNAGKRINHRVRTGGGREGKLSLASRPRTRRSRAGDAGTEGGGRERGVRNTRRIFRTDKDLINFPVPLRPRLFFFFFSSFLFPASVRRVRLRFSRAHGRYVLAESFPRLPRARD